MVAKDAVQLTDVFIAAAAHAGAGEIDLTAMRISAFAGEHVGAIADALPFIDVATLDADTIAAYREFRATVTYPDDLALLPAIPAPTAA